MSDLDRVGWGIVEWGKRYGFPRSTSYYLVSTGRGPEPTQIPGTEKKIVTREADERWQREKLGIKGE